jgi:tetratricopeptide (TPR) repeat protein
VATAAELDSLRDRAASALRNLAGLASDEQVNEAKALVESLRDHREYELMGKLAEAVSRRDPKDPKNRRLYAQYLIDTGKATAAIDLLRPVAQRLPKDHPEHAEATGLLGRAYKQIFFDAGDKTSAGAREALKSAIESYRKPFEENVNNTWHGVNLVALLTRARRLGVRVARDLDPRDVATRVIAALEAAPENARDAWYLPTLAEASLGLGDWSKVEGNIRQYADMSKTTPAFLIASTLRQFTQVWDLEQVDDRGRKLVDILRARLACTPDGTVEVTPEQMRALQSQEQPDAGQLQAVLGPDGVETYRWWTTGRERALSVASIRRRLGIRKGTGFVLRAADLGLEPADELVLLTNYHVVNAQGVEPGIKPGEAEITFEGMTPQRQFTAAAILWSSPVEQYDATILRLQPALSDVTPLPVASELPALKSGRTTYVYVIGHPSGGELAFSFRGNDLLDHEGPPDGKPRIAGVWRVHYKATTEVGSSGSPVFNSSGWEVIALHHSGSKSMSMLNGKAGIYGANEGISLRSIATAPKT